MPNFRPLGRIVSEGRATLNSPRRYRPRDEGLLFSVLERGCRERDIIGWAWPMFYRRYTPTGPINRPLGTLLAISMVMRLARRSLATKRRRTRRWTRKRADYDSEIRDPEGSETKDRRSWQVVELEMILRCHLSNILVVFFNSLTIRLILFLVYYNYSL